MKGTRIWKVVIACTLALTLSTGLPHWLALSGDKDALTSRDHAEMADVPDAATHTTESETQHSADVATTSIKAVHHPVSSEQSSLWAALREAKLEIHRITEHQAAMAGNEDATHVASNEGQNYRIRFLKDRLRILPGHDHADWAMEMGYQHAGMRSVRQTGSRLEYVEPHLTEWFHNKPQGVEHGFTVRKKLKELTHPLSGQLKVDLQVTGLRPAPDKSAAEDGQSMVLLNASGEAVLRYSKLLAWDANGRELAARMTQSQDGIQLLVDDTNAAYPIEIDPLITSIEQVLGPEVLGGGKESDYFGYAMDMDGNTAVITAVDGAYVLVRTGETWDFQAKLRAGLSDTLGSAVAIDGDTIVLGNHKVLPGGVAHVFVRSGTTWSLQQELAIGDGISAGQYGFSVDVDGDTAVLGANHDDDNGSRSGSVYVFTRSGTTWTEQQKIVADDGEANDEFGESLALAGDTLIVGCPQNYVDSTRSGSAYVYTRVSTTWSEVATLAPSDGGNGDRYGGAMCLEGNTLMIGAKRKYVVGSGSGAVYVYSGSGASWSFVERLIPSDSTALDEFGTSISMDGDHAVIGAAADWDAGTQAGSAYYFTQSGGAWHEQQKLFAFNPVAYTQFGFSVAVENGWLMSSAYPEATEIGGASGRVYVYQLDGQSWLDDTSLTAGDSGQESGVGNAVAICANTIAVGSPEDNDNETDSGAVYVFTRVGGTWSTQQKIIPPDGERNDGFGSAVAVDGDTLVVSSVFDDVVGLDSGTVYVYVRSGGSWSLQQQISPADAASDDEFGFDVDVSGDTFIAGARYDGDNGYQSGSAYIYHRTAGSWTLQQKITPADGTNQDEFGYSVSIDGDTTAIGSRYDDDQGSTSGSAYVYVRNTGSWSLQQKLAPSILEVGDIFGMDLCLDADSLIVGASGVDSVSGWTHRGSAFVFTRTANTWSFQQELASEADHSFQLFGEAVSLAGDIAIVGAMTDRETGPSKGAAYIYERTGGTWSLHQKIFDANGEGGDNFGFDVAVDQDTALVGTHRDGVDLYGDTVIEQGAVFVYRLSGNSDGDSLTDFQEQNIYGTDPDDPDSDNDGLNDGYEIEVSGTDPNSQDSDADGYHDNAEVIAGSDPNGGTSVPFFMSRISPSGNQFEIATFSRTGHSYLLQSNASLSGTWQDVGSSQSGTGERMTWMVSPAASSNFYRVIESVED